MDAAATGSNSDGLLAQILLKQGEMGTQLAVITEKLNDLPDHEQRIRTLERWRYGLPVSFLLSAGSIAIGTYSWLHH